MSALPMMKPLVVDQWMLDVLKDCTQVVFETTFGLNVSVKNQPKSLGVNECIKGDVSGVIGIVQESFEGSLIVSFQKEALFYALNQVYSEQFEAMNDSALQGAGELTNMIFGQFKIKLNELGYNIQMAIPSIIRSEDHQIHHFDGEQCGIQLFLLDEKFPFRVSIVLNQN